LLRAARPLAAGEEVTFDYLDLAHELATNAAAATAAAAAAGRGGGGGDRGGGGAAAPPPGVTATQAGRARLREHFGFDCECVVCLREMSVR